jgi:uncharacterized membrane protein
VDTYLWLKLVHILAAIVAVGTNITYFMWLRWSRHEPNVALARGVRALDARLANPAYAVLPITGALMVVDGNLGFSTFWIAVAIGLYVAVGGAIAGLLFGPSLRRQVALVESGDVAPDVYAAAVRRTTTTGLITMIPVAAILFLMVMKPTP